MSFKIIITLEVTGNEEKAMAALDVVEDMLDDGTVQDEINDIDDDDDSDEEKKLFKVTSALVHLDRARPPRDHHVAKLYALREGLMHALEMAVALDYKIIANDVGVHLRELERVIDRKKQED
jgi:hypothetical protein